MCTGQRSLGVQNWRRIRQLEQARRIAIGAGYERLTADALQIRQNAIGVTPRLVTPFTGHRHERPGGVAMQRQQPRNSNVAKPGNLAQRYHITPRL